MTRGDFFADLGEKDFSATAPKGNIGRSGFNPNGTVLILPTSAFISNEIDIRARLLYNNKENEERGGFMQIIGYPSEKTALPRLAVALGFFDGAHVGHRRLIERMKSEAEQRGLKTAIFTFPSESAGLKSGAVRLYGTEEKLEILAEFNTDYIILADFDALCSATPEQFVLSHLWEGLNVRLAVAGYNFRFGKRAAGDINDLVRLMSQLGGETVVLEEERLDGVTLSTTAIREALSRGECELATRMLGEPYFVNSTVIRGRGIGSSFGFPTINTERAEGLPLPRGVYATVVTLEERRLVGVTNIGVCPTFAPREEHLETMLLDFCQTVYGKRVKIEFIARLRDEAVFPSPEKLKEQIDRDAEKAALIAAKYL